VRADRDRGRLIDKRQLYSDLQQALHWRGAVDGRSSEAVRLGPALESRLCADRNGNCDAA
jgi:hypothetical protein